MKTLPKPSVTAEDSYKQSVAFSDGDLSVRLNGQLVDIVNAASAFDVAANDAISTSAIRTK